VDQDGVTQVIVSATNLIRSYDAATGNVLWECDGLTTNVIPSPVAADDAVVCMSWYGDAAVKAISLATRGRATTGNGLLWSYDRLAPYCPSPVVYEGQIFFNRANTDVFVSLDARTGEEKVGPARLPGLGGELYASPVAAAGRIYFVGREGTAIVLQFGKELELVAVNKLEDGFDASPAIAGRQIFLRGRQFLYCLQ
jgi:outer membrane protein assembly factor BamB